MKIGSPEFMFMAESEGVTEITQTRRTYLNKIVKECRDAAYYSETYARAKAKRMGITLTAEEEEYIKSYFE